MKVLIVSTSDIGGAANACLRLHEGLIKNGCDSDVLLSKKQRNVYRTHLLNPNYTIFHKLYLICLKILKFLKIYNYRSKKDKFISSRSSNLEMFSYPKSNYDITKSDLYKEADVVNLHWVANFLDYKSFFQKNKKPLVWTLHDMNPFTGGEHYEELFDGIDKSGKPLKRMKTKKEIDESDAILEFKKNLVKGVNNLTIVAPSRWLQYEASRSDVFKGNKVVHIPYGIDSDIFDLKDKVYSREVFNIPKNKKVILFVSESINNSRKGFVLLKKAFEKLSSDKILLCAIGNSNINSNNSENVVKLGPIYHERLMALAYSAADLFVIPSLMDNLPNTVLESIMCGTPVVGFEVGGIPDMIQNGVNGYLADEISAESLYAAIMKYLESPDRFDREKIRDLAREKYDLNIQAKRYKELFNKITNQ
jgi:glycosyltransferase involved in cell wall biosynthesis